MKRNFISRLACMAVFLLLFSCSQELLQNEQDYALRSQRLYVERLNREQLLQKHSPTLAKISSLYSGKSYSRIYTDTGNGFSIDTDKAILIEDANGNKSYTFEITRAQPDSLLYENLVLKDKGNNTFAAFLMQYKRTLFQLPDTPPDSDLNHYISIQDLGIKNGADVFGKTVVCYKTFAHNTYVPGTPCVNGHTDPAVCDLTGDAAPVPGYWITGYDVMPYLCDNQPDPFTTVPLDGGGGSWNGNTLPDMSSLFDHCEKLNEWLNDPKFKQKYDKLTKISPPNENVFNLSGELAAYMRYPTIGTNTSPAFVDIDLPACATDGNIPSFEEGMGGLMHTHNNESCNGGTPVKAPSPTDIQTFINILIREAMQYTGSYGNAYSFVATEGGNYMLMYSATNYPGPIKNPEWEKLQIEYEKVFTLLYSDKGENVTQADIEKVFTKFMKEKINRPGLEVYRVTPTSRIKIEYNPTTKTVKETPCPI